MGEWSANNSADRAKAVWAQLLDCYGESLIRKFDSDEPPSAWVGAIVSLNDYQIRQGVRRLVLSGKPHPPSLPEFMKLCRTVGHSDDIADTQSMPVHPALTREDDPQFDAWGLLANRRLLQYITKKIPENPKRWGPHGNVLHLVAFKNRWADIMRDSATADGVPIPEQEACWNECMRMGEAEIAKAVAA